MLVNRAESRQSTARFVSPLLTFEILVSRALRLATFVQTARQNIYTILRLYGALNQKLVANHIQTYGNISLQKLLH
jgi:hypothetical protein